MRRDEDYQLDDLVRDQRRQMWIAGVVIVVVGIYTALGGTLPGQGPRPLGDQGEGSGLSGTLAPVVSAAR